VRIRSFDRHSYTFLGIDTVFLAACYLSEYIELIYLTAQRAPISFGWCNIGHGPALGNMVQNGNDGWKWAAVRGNPWGNPPGAASGGGRKGASSLEDFFKEHLRRFQGGIPKGPGRPIFLVALMAIGLSSSGYVNQYPIVSATGTWCVVTFLGFLFADLCKPGLPLFASHSAWNR